MDTCLATSYKPVIKRDELGAITMSGAYQCTGCRLEFTDIDTWRIDEAGQVYVYAGSQHLKKREALSFLRRQLQSSPDLRLFYSH